VTAGARWLLVSCVLLGLLPLGSGAASAERFRIVQETAERKGDTIVLMGRVFNEDRRDVLDVQLTVQALDASGKVVARGITYLAGVIPGRSSARFEAKVPRAKGADRFHLSVTSFREGLASEAP
jgi:hypothetical protein